MSDTESDTSSWDDAEHSARSNEIHHTVVPALLPPPLPPEGGQQSAGDFVYIQRYAYTAKKALRGETRVWRILFAGETAGTQDTVAWMPRDVYAEAGKYHVTLGTPAFESVRWYAGEREHHDQRVRRQGHLDRKVLDSCMGPVYYCDAPGWCACFDGKFSDSKYVIHYHNENDEFQMDKQTVACIGRNVTVGHTELG